MMPFFLLNSNFSGAYLNLKSSLVFFDDFLLEFCACSRFLFSGLKSALLFGLLLLVANHLLNAGSLELLLLLLHHQKLLLLSLLLLHTFSLLKLFSLQLLFSHRNMIFDVILHVLVPLEKHLLFKLLFLLSLFLDAILLLITLLNMHDVLSFFLSFLDLFPCL